MQLSRPQWLQIRRTGIGGSDVAPILGLSPFRSPMDVWLEKKGIRQEKPDPDRDFLLDLGQRLEPVIAGLYERQTGRELVIPSGVAFHRQFKELLASPDRLVAFADQLERGVELKTENQFTDQFGDAGTDQVPIHYTLQCVHYMAVLNCPRWDVAVLHGGVKFSVYQLERDTALEEMVIEQLREWWAAHIVADVPPDVDGSQAWRVFIHHKYPSNLKPVETLPEHSHLMDTLRKIRDAEKALEVMRTKTENELKEIIGEREGIVTNVGRVTWKKTKDAEFTDWEGAFRMMARKYGTHPDMQEEILKSFRATRPGMRRFLFTPRKEFYGVQFANESAASIDAGKTNVSALPPGNGERGTGGASESGN